MLGSLPGGRPCCAADADAAVGALRDPAALVDGAALDGRAHHASVAGADGDDEVGFLAVHHDLEASPLAESFFHIVASGGVRHGLVERFAGVGSNDHANRARLQNILGQS